MRIALALLAALGVFAAEREVDRTFLYRRLPGVPAAASDVTTATCRYKPGFGAGDRDARLLRGIERFGEMTVEPGGASAPVSYPAEEQIYVLLEGGGELIYGGVRAPVRKNDFMYLPPGISHGLACAKGTPCRVIVMGFRIPRGMTPKAPPQPMIANIDDVPLQVVGNHPPSTLYRLLMGDTRSTRDRIAAGSVLTSLFTMEFAPGGTNFPHHHETEEEIYLVLEGTGDMVAGGGMDGVEGRRPARPGDAYFFRLNATVGFYSASGAGAGKAKVLAIRSRFPFQK